MAKVIREFRYKEDTYNEVILKDADEMYVRVFLRTDLNSLIVCDGEYNVVGEFKAHMIQVIDQEIL